MTVRSAPGAGGFDVGAAASRYRRWMLGGREYLPAGNGRTVIALRQRISMSADTLPFYLAWEQLTSWLGALNDLRLVLGTRLNVTEETYQEEMDPEAPDTQAYGLFFYLGWLEEQIVEALASGGG